MTHSDWASLSFRGRHGVRDFRSVSGPLSERPRNQWPPYAREDDYFSPAGVRSLFEYLVGCGVRRVYWRVFNGGRAMYPSAIAEVQAGPFSGPRNSAKDELYFAFQERVDYQSWDPLQIAVDAAREHQLELYAWYTFREDDHSVGFLSSFARAHPGFCQVNRRGQRLYANLSWAFPEVVEYKRQIIEELLAHNVDGLLLDYCRKNSFKPEPTSRLEECWPGGYEQPIIASFRQTTGRDPLSIPEDDPAWHRHRANVETTFLRQVRDWTCGRGLAAMVYESQNYDAHFLDLRAWQTESLVTEFIPIFQDRPFNSIHEPNRVRPCPRYTADDGIGPPLDALRCQLLGAAISPGVYCYDFTHDTAGQIELHRRILTRRFQEAAASQSAGLVVFESSHLVLDDLREFMKATTSP